MFFLTDNRQPVAEVDDCLHYCNLSDIENSVLVANEESSLTSPHCPMSCNREKYNCYCWLSPNVLIQNSLTSIFDYIRRL